MSTARLDLPVRGMSCAACATRIEHTLQDLPGVSETQVNFATEKATVHYDSNCLNVTQLIRQVENIGFQIPLEHTNITVADMQCADCATNIERELNQVDGVVDAQVKFATEQAHIAYLPSHTDRVALHNAIRDTGYTPQETDIETASDTSSNDKLAEFCALKRRLLVSVILSLPIITGSMFSEMFGGPAWLSDPALLLVLATPVQFWVGWPFYRGFWNSLKHKTADMNTLIAIGTSAAYGYSVAATLFPVVFRRLGLGSHVYFDTAVIIITLIVLGRVLEARARGQTSAAIRKLIGFQPKMARVIREEREIDVPIDTVQIGDLIRVRPGEQVPVDGCIVTGRATLNESMLTGESIPLDKTSGDIVHGATLNTIGSFTMEATRVGNATTLSLIIRMVEEAQGTKAPIQRLADIAAGWFVPVVLGIAAITFITWAFFGPPPTLTFALLNMVAVLIIACPCALGLATPTAIMVGTGKGAEYGVLFRHSASLETAHRLQSIVLDKTGTLTLGQPAVTDIIPHNGYTRTELLRLAATAERGSEHPLGQALLNAADADGLTLAEVHDFELLPGHGIRATIDADIVIVIGNTALMQAEGIALGQATEGIHHLTETGKTPICVAINGQAAGIIAVTDTIKPHVTDAVHTLQSLGLDVIMLTGDHQRTAEAIGQQLGIKHIVAEVLPQDKAQIIKDLQATGQRVAMVGDGINDAPALAQADVGIAMGTGTDIAMETADCTLMTGDLRGVVTAIQLSRRTMRTIKQNLFWAFIYNVLGLPIAAGVLYPIIGTLLNPAFAAAAMAMSSVSVLTNSLRLRRFHP